MARPGHLLTLASLAARLQPQVDVPMIDSVEAGVRHALALARDPAAPHAVTDGFYPAVDARWIGIMPDSTGQYPGAAPARFGWAMPAASRARITGRGAQGGAANAWPALD